MAIFATTGSIGIVLLLLWFVTDHTATANNYNLLWAFPLSLFLAFFIVRKNVSVKLTRYVVLLILFLALLAIHWFTGVQVFAIGLIPLLIALAVRYFYLFRYLKTKENV